MHEEGKMRERAIELLSRFEQREIIEIATHLFANRRATSIEDAVQKTLRLCEMVRENPDTISLYRKHGSSSMFVFFTKRDGTCFDHNMMIRWGARLSPRKDVCIFAVSSKMNVQEVRKRIHDFVISKPSAHSGEIIPFKTRHAKIFR
jgi:plasmid stabilization system protein ParE